MNYVIDMTKGDFSDLIKGLEDYEKWIHIKIDALCKKIAERCVQQIHENFWDVKYDGVLDLSVEPAEKEAEACYVVKAGGATLLFVEFGAGVHYPADHPEGNGYTHGSYGKGLGNNDYWFYTGQPGTAGGELAQDPRTGYIRMNTTITHGNPANMPVYNAMKTVGAEIESIAMEVFST